MRPEADYLELLEQLSADTGRSGPPPDEDDTDRVVIWALRILLQLRGMTPDWRRRILRCALRAVEDRG